MNRRIRLSERRSRNVCAFGRVLVILLACTALSSAQPCGEPINCPNRAYSYRFCTPSGIQNMCATDPWRNQQGWRPLHPTGRICLYLASQPQYQPTTTYLWPLRNGDSAEVFRPDLIWNDFECAERKWECVCGTQNRSCQCRIEVRFVTNENDPFIRDHVRRAIAIAWSYADARTCELFCEASPLNPGSFIVVNMTRRFLFPTGGRYARNIVYNELLWETVNNRASDTLSAYNFCEVLIHEIGHHYGLGHHTDCPPATGVMNATAVPNQRRRDLSQDDRCAYAKLYCADIVPVEENLVSGNVVLNDGSLVVPLPLITTSGELQIRLYDVLGRCYPVHAERYGNHVQIQTRQLAQGVYILAFEYQQMMVKYSLIIQH